MVHLPLVDYFQCGEDMAAAMDGDLEGLGPGISRATTPDAYLGLLEVVSEEENGGQHLPGICRRWQLFDGTADFDY